MTRLFIRKSIQDKIDPFIDKGFGGNKFQGIGVWYYTKFRLFRPIFQIIEPIAEAGYDEIERIDEI